MEGRGEGDYIPIATSFRPNNYIVDWASKITNHLSFLLVSIDIT